METLKLNRLNIYRLKIYSNEYKYWIYSKLCDALNCSKIVAIFEKIGAIIWFTLKFEFFKNYLLAVS